MSNLILPVDLLARPATRDDAQAICDLNRAQEIAELGSSESILADVLELWEQEQMQLSMNTQAITTSTGELVGYTGVMATQQGVLLDAHTIVAAPYRETQLMEYLLQWAEMRTHLLLDANPALARKLSTWGVTPQTTALLEQHGYTIDGSDYHMEITLDDVPTEPTALAGITIRRFQVGQEERAVHAVIAEAFPDIDGRPYRPYEEWYVRVFQKSTSFEPEMIYVAVADGQVVGCILCRVYPEEQSGYIWQLAVRRNWRRRGIALQLLVTAFGEYYRRGMFTIQLSVDKDNQTGAHKLYTQAGMHKRSQVDSMVKAL